MAKPPETHILMSTYNAGKFVERAIHSALSQTEPLRVIVHDDGSTDRTQKILTDLKTVYPDRLVVKLNDKNRGHGTVWGELVDRSIQLDPKAPIMWLDADDHFAGPQAVRNVMRRMRAARAEICLFNYDIQWGDNSAALKRQSAVKVQVQKLHARIVKDIASLAPQAVDYRTHPEIARSSVVLWSKAWSADVKKHWVKPAEGAFSVDVSSMAMLLNASRVTALDEVVVNYLRHSQSVTSTRTPENFLYDFPNQHRRLQENINNSPELRAAALSYTMSKFDSGAQEIKAEITLGRPSFTPDVLKHFNQLKTEFAEAILTPHATVHERLKKTRRSRFVGPLAEGPTIT